MCDFCEKFDFGRASYVVGWYGADIVMASNGYRFSENHQFRFCPKCGTPRGKMNILPPIEERKFPSAYWPESFRLI